MDTVEYTFHSDHTGQRRLKTKNPFQVGRPIGSFYDPFSEDTTNSKIDRTHLSFHWEYSSNEQALTVNFKEISKTVKWIITDYTNERINTKPIEGPLNTVVLYYGLYDIRGLRTIFERKK